MANRDIVVVGASAGGVEAMTELVKSLPADLPAAVFVVIHFPPSGISILPNLLARRGRLPAFHAKDGQSIRPGRIYVAPPDHHLLVHEGFVRVVHGPSENGCRPAVDPLFRSAAAAYGPRVIGVILSGFRDDGTAGLMAVKRRGGLAIVQDPEDALASGMPTSAIRHVPVDRVLPVAEIGPALVDFVREPLEVAAEASAGANEAGGERLRADVGPETGARQMQWEADMAEMDWETVSNEDRPGTPVSYSCPACGGTLWEYQDGDLVRFRCRVGHAFSSDSLMSEQVEALEEAFWVALRALEEHASLAHRMAARAARMGHSITQARLEEQARDADGRARLIRNVLVQGKISAEARVSRDAEEEEEAEVIGDMEGIESLDGAHRRGQDGE